VIRVTSFSEAIAAANATRFGLAAGLVSENEGLWNIARSDIRAGILNWNRPTVGASGGMPFGGPGLSGNFRPGAYYAADYSAWPQASQLTPEVGRQTSPGFP
jgi:succinylglutamic semialdehyde dehydrogenase